MKTKRSEFFQKTIFLTLLATATHSAQAGFQYGARDVLIGIRQAGGTAELVVNAGSVSNLLALAAGQTLQITNLTAGQLSTTFADLNNLSWAAVADVRANGDATYPLDTLWLTRQRMDIATQTTPWQRRNQFLQPNAGAQIEAIGNKATAYGNSQPTGTNNTSTGIILPPAPSTYAYGTYMGVNGNLQGNWPGVVEATTPFDFDISGTPMRADFYEIKPGSGPSTYRGYFQFNTDGTLSFTAASVAVVVPQPTIVSIVRNGTQSTVTFTTVNGGQYSLRYSSNLTTPPSSWTAVGSPVGGDGTNKSIDDSTVNNNDQRFYIISAQ